MPGGPSAGLRATTTNQWSAEGRTARPGRTYTAATTDGADRRVPPVNPEPLGIAVEDHIGLDVLAYTTRPDGARPSAAPSLVA